jgi:hypothetical protein
LLVNQRGTSRACIISAPQRTTAPERGSRKQQEQQQEQQQQPQEQAQEQEQ